MNELWTPILVGLVILLAAIALVDRQRRRRQARTRALLGVRVYISTGDTPEYFLGQYANRDEAVEAIDVFMYQSVCKTDTAMTFEVRYEDVRA